MDSSIGNTIRELRERANMSQRNLADKFSPPKDVTVISRWENGRANISLRNLMQMALIFNKPLDFFCPSNGQTSQANKQKEAS